MPTSRLFYGLDLGVKPLSRLKTLVDSLLIRGSFTPINWLLDLRSYGLAIARKTTSVGAIDWEGELILYNSISFSISDFRSFIHGLTSATRDLLYREILFENRVPTTNSPTRSIPIIPWSRIFDNPLDSTPFQNFLGDSRTDLGLDHSEKWLYNRIATSPDLASRFTIPSQEFSWHHRKLLDWIQGIQNFLEKLLVLFHITGGQPARFPELGSIRFSNSIETGLRNIFLEGQMVFFVTYYHKGYSIQDSTKIIHRYLPREVGELLVYYLWLVVPFLSRISLEVFQKPLSEYLFEDLSRKRHKAYSKISGDRFRTIFRRETLSGLGLALNPSEYRHIAIGISRRFLSKNLEFQPEDPAGLEDEDMDYEDDIMDLQATHGSKTAGIVYARGLLQGKGEILSLKRRFQEASLVSNIISIIYIYIYIP